MNTFNKKNTLLALTLLFWSLHGSDALAQPFHGGRNGPRSGMEQEDGRDMGKKMLERMTHRLDLSSEQQDQIEEIFGNYESELESARTTMHDARSKLHAAVNADIFDETAIREASKVTAAAEESMAVIRGKIASQVRAVLTEEQKVLQAQMKEERRGRKGWKK